MSFFKRLALTCALLFTMGNVSFAAALTDGQEIKLWPGKAPGSESVSFHNEVIERSKDPKVHDRAMVHIDTPHMVVSLPKKPNGTAVIVGPGGGYARVVIDKEGADIAKWLNDIGVTVFILRYRLPEDPHNKNREDVALEDGQRAMRIVRSHAKEWGINPNKIGISGFSAGGHMAASVSTCYDRKVYEPVDAVDKVSARPDFSILGYPVISMLDEYAHQGTKKRLFGKDANGKERKPPQETLAYYSMELQVDAKTPPAFVFCAKDDDVVPAVNSVRYAEALRSFGTPVELHVYTYGKHGFGIGAKLKTGAKDWSKACTNWLRDMKFI